MYKLFTIALLLLGANIALSAEPKALADTVAEYVVADDNAAIHERMAPSVKRAISVSQMTAASARLRSLFGNPTSVTYWRTLKGFKQSGLTRVPIIVVEYRMVSDKYAESLALAVTLVEEEGELYVQGYNFMRNMGKAVNDSPKSTGA